jgi:hypothetical protein
VDESSGQRGRAGVAADGTACCSSRWPVWLRRAPIIGSWIVPGAILVLVPKCPACLALYVLLGTGTALSLPAAQYLRLGALGLGGALLVGLSIRAAVRLRTAGQRPAAIPSRRQDATKRASR